MTINIVHGEEAASVVAQSQARAVTRREEEAAAPRKVEPVGETVLKDEVIESAIEKNGQEFVLGGRTIQFNYDRDARRVIVKVVSDDSGEVVRQIPPEEYMKFIAQFSELMGVLFDSKF